MKKRISLFIVIIFVLGGCSFKHDLKIEAKVIYNMGGPQPVARQKFYLVSIDPMDLRGDDPKLKEKIDKADETTKTSLLMQSALLPLLKKGLEEKTLAPGKEKTFLNIFESTKPTWDSYLVAETQTDFDGKAVFKDVPAGEYWLVGQTETRAAFTLWDLKIKVPHPEEKLLLDQNNSLFSK